MSLVDQAKAAGLSPEEIEALEAAEAEERAGQELLRSVAGEDAEAAAEAAPEGEGAAPEAAAAAPAAEPAAAEEEPAAAEVPERDRPYAPQLRAAEIADNSERLKAIATEKAEALQKLVAGELEAADYAELDNRLTTERETIVSAQTKAQLTAEHNEQMQQGMFTHELNRFLKTAAKEGIEYSKPEERARFERAFSLVASDPANAAKGFDDLDDLFGEAHRMVKAMKGIQAAPKPVATPAAPAAAAAPAAPAARQVPKTVGDIPAAAPAAVGDDMVSRAAGLEGEDLERYMAGLSKADHEKLLRSAQ